MRLPEGAIQSVELRFADTKFQTRKSVWWVEQVKIAAGAL